MIQALKTLLSIFLALILTIGHSTYAQENTNQNKFRQLGTELPTPNVYRTASGAPGYEYWQQQADYMIDVRVDDEKQTIHGTETITYYNNSPDELSYLWMQLDQNIRTKESDAFRAHTGKIYSERNWYRFLPDEDRFDGGFKIVEIKDAEGRNLKYDIVNTMMHVDLNEPLSAGTVTEFTVKWWYNINDIRESLRSGFEYFSEDDNYLYAIAQFYPRMVKYSDVDGWQHRQFYGTGEFALEFGNFDVKITVPGDHLVAATGELQNAHEMLTSTQLERLKKARTSYDKPVIIVTQEEAIANERNKSKEYRTWHFKAENVRDFAFASSRKFIWDAMAVKLVNGNSTMAMSMYPKEANPLWEEVATKTVAHTLKWYSHYSIPYPHPVAWAINAEGVAMEYPMVGFNYGRTNPDGSYSEYLKYRVISVIIHETGHNFFPMIVNSDERQWMWLDEGINAFLQFLTEQQWEENYPSRRGPLKNALNYMKGDKSKMTPIMTDAESLIQLGNNAYLKPATALHILRSTIIGEERFDVAFKTYANRWKYKYATPADFFRTMEDASGVDLDWFWRGWFYTTDHVDIAIDNVNYFTPSSINEAAEIYFGEDVHFYEVTFTNEGGLVMPIILQLNYTDGTKEIRKFPVEIWRYNNDIITKTIPVKKEVESFLLDPNSETADVDESNNHYPRE